MTPVKDQEDELKNRFWTWAAKETLWKFSTLQRTPNRPSCQRFIKDVLYIHAENWIIERTVTASIKWNQWRVREITMENKKYGDSSEKNADNVILTTFVEASLAEQRRWERNWTGIN